MKVQSRYGAWRAGLVATCMSFAGFGLGCAGGEVEQAGGEALQPVSVTSSTQGATASCVSADAARNAPVTSSGYYGTGTPALAVDGNISTAWATNASTGAWMQVDLGQVKTIDRVVLTWGWDPNFGSSADSVIEGSTDGSTWTTLVTTTRQSVGCDGNTGGDACYRPESLSFTPTATRYVRFRGTRWNGGWGHVNDFEVYPTCTTCQSADFARNAPATSSGYYGTGTPALAVDGNISTAWATNTSTGAWMQVDLGQAKTINRVVLTWGWDPNFGSSADSVVEGSTDGSTWTTLVTTTRQSVGCDGNHGGDACYTPESLSFTPTAARYVRFRGTRWNGGWGHVNDFEVYGGSTTCSAPQVMASYDTTLRVPRCSGAFSSCDSGTLLTGRAQLGPELNAPNTLQGGCADGTAGSFHGDESVERLVLSTVDGGPLAPGKTVKLSASVWVWGASSDSLDLYFTNNATAPSWQPLGTLVPNASGLQTLETTYVLPAGSLQAIRAQFRYQGTASSPCTSGAYDDRDDLAFSL